MKIFLKYIYKHVCVFIHSAPTYIMYIYIYIYIVCPCYIIFELLGWMSLSYYANMAHCSFSIKFYCNSKHAKG